MPRKSLCFGQRGLRFWLFRQSHFLVLPSALACAALATGCASVSADKSVQLSAKISVIPTAVEFKEVVVGQQNSQTLRVSNTSKDSVLLEHLAISGKGFSLAAAKVPISLAPGASAHVTVAFTPAGATSVSGVLEIRSGSDSAKDTVSIPLAGSGQKASPQLVLSPGSVNFGSLPVHSSVAQTVTLKNSGNIGLTVSSLSLPSTTFSVSSLSPGSWLAPGQSLEFQVTFHPAAAGASWSGLSIGSAGLPAPVTLALSGSGASSPSSPTSNAPVPPTVTPASHSISLNWDASSSSVVGYHVYRSPVSGGPYARISSSTISGLNYADRTVQAGTRYFYVVSALDSSGIESAYSNEASADVPN